MSNSKNGNPLQYSCLENPMDGGAWKAAVHGVTMSQTRLSDFTSLHVRPLEQDRKPRNKLMHLWVPYF